MTIKDFYMGKLLGDIIGSKHNQHCLMAIIGRTGSGKSSAAIQIAHETAKYMATLNSHKAEYYFNIDHVAIIIEDEITRVMKHTKKHGIYILDDIGVGYNSRLWQSKANIIMNDIIQTFRTQNNLMILTVPDPTFIDKVPRSSLRYQINMKDANFDMGYSLGAMQELKRDYKSGKNIYPYPTSEGCKYVRVKFERPPSFLADEYEIRRETIQAKMQADNIEKLEKLFAEQKENDIPKLSKKDKILEINRDVQAGIYPDLKAGLKSNKLSNDLAYARNIVSMHG